MLSSMNYKLDLHGVRHIDVRSKVIRFIEDLWGKNVSAEIITGNSNEMKKLVIEVLEEYKLEYFDGGIFGINNAVITTTI
jgi:hypothetical protein